MGLNWKCPFHSFMAGAITFGTIYFILNKLLVNSSSLTSNKKKINRYDVEKRWSDAIEYNDVVYISGQIGDGITIEEQTKSALNYVDLALAKAGTNKSNIIDVIIWLSNMEEDYEKMNEIYDAWLVDGKAPCRACIQAKLAKSIWKIEIKVIATTTTSL